MNIITVPITQLIESEDNPRTSFDDAALNQLAESLKQDGLLDPLRGVREGDYIRIESGHRRFRAAQIAGLQDIPVQVIDQSREDEQVRALITNLQREDLNVIDEARAYQSLVATQGLTVLGVAERCGVPQQRVTARLELLEFDDSIIHLFAQGKLSPNTRTILKAIARVSTKLAVLTAKATAKNGWDTALAKNTDAVMQNVARDSAAVYRLPGVYAVENMKLSKDAQVTIDQLLETLPEYARSSVQFSQDDRDAALSAGVGFQPKGAGFAYVDDTEWLHEQLKVALERKVAQVKERAAQEAAQRKPKVADLPPTERELAREVKRAERQAELEGRDIAHGHNLDLGRVIMEQLAKIDVGPMPLELAKAISAGLLGERRSEVFMAGLRYCLPQFIAEQEEKNGTKRVFISTPEAAAHAMMQWLNGAKTSSEVIGRTVAALVAAQYADQGVVPASQRRPSGLPRTPDDWAYAKLMDQFAKVLVPRPLQGKEWPSTKHVAREMSKLAKAQEQASA